MSLSSHLCNCRNCFPLGAHMLDGIVGWHIKNAKVLHLKDKLNDKLKNVHFSEEPGPHVVQLIFGDFRKSLQRCI